MTHKNRKTENASEMPDNQECAEIKKKENESADMATSPETGMPAAEKHASTSRPEADEGAEGDAVAKEEKPDMEELLRAAEERGYLRGRNERIEALMQAPGEYERVGTPQGTDDAEMAKTEFLSHRRVSIWDY